MKATNVKAAWNMVNELVGICTKNEKRSEGAGYAIYTAVEQPGAWVSDLGNRLEVNLANGETVNVFIETETETVSRKVAEQLNARPGITMEHQEADHCANEEKWHYFFTVDGKKCWAQVSKAAGDESPLVAVGTDDEETMWSAMYNTGKDRWVDHAVDAHDWETRSDRHSDMMDTLKSIVDNALKGQTAEPEKAERATNGEIYADMIKAVSRTEKYANYDITMNDGTVYTLTKNMDREYPRWTIEGVRFMAEATWADSRIWYIKDGHTAERKCVRMCEVGNAFCFSYVGDVAKELRAVELEAERSNGCSDAAEEAKPEMKDIEITRHNVTLEQFINYVNRRCAQKGLEKFDVNAEWIMNPPYISDEDYRVMDDGRVEHRRGDHCWTGSLEEESVHYAAETDVQKPGEWVTYLRDFDGSEYKEICEFTLDDGDKGTGYFYKMVKEAA